MKIYHNPRCRKSREGVQYLSNKGIEFKIIEYLKNEISEKKNEIIINQTKYLPNRFNKKK